MLGDCSILEKLFDGIVEKLANCFTCIHKNNQEFLAKAMAEEMKLWMASGKENLLRNMPERWGALVNSMALAGLANVDRAESLYTNEYVDRI